MKGDYKLDDFLEKIKMPSDMEVENAGLRFEKRLRKIKMVRWIIWSSGSVAAIIAIAIMVMPLLGNESEDMEIASTTKIVVPTLIMSNGNSVGLDKKKISDEIKVSNIRVTDNHISYDSVMSSQKIDPRPVEIVYNTLVIPVGYTYDVTLSDGSRVTLNAGSRLKYPVEFKGDSREVELSGEAFFRVEKSDKPFEVNVSGSKIRVYGTQFNVKTLQMSNILETVLVEGNIGFIPPGSAEIKVVPGELVTFDAGSGKVNVRQVDTENFIAWLNGAFKYQDRRLNLVLEDISAWYGVEFDSKIDVASIELTMNLSKKTPIHEVISFLELMTSLTIKKEGGNYIIK